MFAIVQGYVAGQQRCQEGNLGLSIPMASCNDLQTEQFLLGTALHGVAVCVGDQSGRILPPEIPGYLYLGSSQTPNDNIATGLRVSYTWDGVLTLLTSEVPSNSTCFLACDHMLQTCYIVQQSARLQVYIFVLAQCHRMYVGLRAQHVFETL